MPASAPSTRKEVRRLIGSLSADNDCILALGTESLGGPQVAGAATGAATGVVKLSPAVDVDAALELLRTAREWTRNGERAALSRQASADQVLQDEASHVRRAAS
ncbi:MAG TPA: hypothetical protein VF459_20930 [Caulobacteraceae bacterium]